MSFTFGSLNISNNKLSIREANWYMDDYNSDYLYRSLGAGNRNWT